MKILITSDWQVALSNLPQCRNLAERILDVCEGMKIRYVIHAGDFKHQYNPIDVEVANFGVNFVRRCVERSITLGIDEGNHDRVGLYRDDLHWLDVLRAAGAQTFDKASLWWIGRDLSIAMLPFRHDPQVLAHDARKLAAQASTVPKGARKILIFHAELKGAHLNGQAISENGVAPGVLCPASYDFCIGGHLHKQHCVGGNIWYVGSPFPMEWGDANQQKGFLIYDSDENTLKSISSGFPGWYDPDLPNFELPATWRGARVRIRTPRELDEGEKETACTKLHLTKGVDVVFQVVHDDKLPEVIEGIDPRIPDEEKIHQYIERTLPDTLKKYDKAVLQYLRGVIGVSSSASALRAREIKFKGCYAKNVLSYEQVEFNYCPGITIVSGTNGAGKTNLLSLLSIALFGTTFKGQKHDRWINRWATKEAAEVIVDFDAAGHHMSVARRRNPAQLRIEENGEDIGKGNRKEQTQKDIESLIGFTWETFANTLYVDQKRENVMLMGRESERKQFLAKMYGLERFARAQELVKEKRDVLRESISVESGKIQAAKHQSNVYVQAIAALDSFRPKENPEDFNRLAAEMKRRVEALTQDVSKARNAEDSWHNKVDTISEDIVNCVTKNAELESIVLRLKGLNGVAACPMCLGEISQEHVAFHLRRYGPLLSQSSGKLAALKNRKATANIAWTAAATERSNLDRQLAEAKTKWHSYKMQADAAAKQAQENLLREKQRDELQAKLDAVNAEQRTRAAAVSKMEKQAEIISYALRAFSRDGIPAFLLASLVPNLNRAAAFYSDKFSDNMIQVRFVVTPEGDADVVVENPSGGEMVEDQSGGEMRLASLIVSFALREAAPKTNLLILDEPGDGLDGEHAAQFARGLREVAPRFGSVMLTTHNPILLGELAGERL